MVKATRRVVYCATPRGSLFLLLAALCLLSWPATAQDVRPRSVGAQTSASAGVNDACTPEFCRVDDKVYRGKQPLIPEGLRELARRGIKTIINLRGRDKTTEAEEQAAQAAGIKYLSYPLPSLSAPKDEDVKAVLAAIAQAEGPVFVHCHHGEDRTGLIIACYRLDHGWTYEQARDEAKQHGMKWVQFGMRDYIKHYAESKTKAAGAAANQSK